MEEQKPLSGQVPPPPPPEIGVRTMQSDLQSMQKSGGEAPQPYIINSGAAAPQKPAAEPAPTPQPKITAQGYTGPEQPIFQETNEPVFTPSEQTVAAGETAAGGTAKKSGGIKIIIWLVAMLAIAGGLGALGYFVIFPILFPSQPEPIAQEPAPTPELPPQPVFPIPEPTFPEPTLPELIIQEPTTTEPIIPISMPEIPAIKTHTSFFQTALNIPQEKIAGDLITLEIFRLSASSSAAAMNSGDFKEIIFEKNNGSAIALSEFLPNLMPEITTDKLKEFFEEDFTAFIFKNAQGAWPGYILKLNSAASSTLVQNEIAALEKTADFGKLFIDGPGAVTQSFKDGKAGELATRYQVYAQKGAALNYGWRDNYLILSASYGGLLEALKKL